MKRSDCNRKHEDELLSKSADRVSSISGLQTAETLEEINQKTLTIRDQFAIAAMQSLISIYSSAEYEPGTSERLVKCQAETAYQIADIMLEARKR